MGNEPTTKKIRSHCRNCGGPTNHEVLAEQQDDFAFGEDIGEWFTRYSMIRCMGCDTIALQELRGWSHDPDRWRTTIYPPPMARRTPVWLTESSFLLDKILPAPIYHLMRETYIAVQNGLMRLAAMGVRATLEHVMIEKVGDRNNFQDNLDAFQQGGFISERSKTSLKRILEAGHAAIHRAWEPSKEDVSTLLDITEIIIATVYVHEGQTEALNNRVPKRPPPAKA